jgi:hypothetical protein
MTDVADVAVDVDGAERSDLAPCQLPLHPACPTTTVTTATRMVSSLLGTSRGDYDAHSGVTSTLRVQPTEIAAVLAP